MFPGIYYSLLADLYNLYPKWNIQPLKKVRATKQQNETTPGNEFNTGKKFNSVHITSAAQNLKIHLYSIYSLQFICYLLFLHRFFFFFLIHCHFSTFGYFVH